MEFLDVIAGSAALVWPRRQTGTLVCSHLKHFS